MQVRLEAVKEEVDVLAVQGQALAVPAGHHCVQKRLQIVLVEGAGAHIRVGDCFPPLTWVHKDSHPRVWSVTSADAGHLVILQDLQQFLLSAWVHMEADVGRNQSPGLGFKLPHFFHCVGTNIATSGFHTFKERGETSGVLSFPTFCSGRLIALSLDCSSWNRQFLLQLVLDLLHGFCETCVHAKEVHWGFGSPTAIAQSLVVLHSKHNVL